MMSSEHLKLAVLVSGRGSDLQSIIDARQSGTLDVDIKLVISNNPDSYGLERARRAGIETVVHRSADYDNIDEFRRRFLEILREHDVNFIVLAGYIKKLPPDVVDHYRKRIINIHPALLPKYGGKGFYGMKVHEAVIKSGDRFSGVTVHYVDNRYDHGDIIYQEKVEVREDDTPETLADRVLSVEHRVLPHVIGLIASGKIK